MTAARIAFWFAAYFSVTGAATTYWPVWLEDRGVGAVEIGFIYMCRQFVSVAATLGAGWLAAHSPDPRRAMLALLAVALAALVAYEFSYGFVALLLVTLWWGAAWHPLMSLGESVAVNATRARGIDYGRVRLWGSVSFVAMATATGWIVERAGPSWVLYLLAFGAGLALPAAALLPAAAPRVSAPEASSGTAHGTAPPRARALLAAPAFLLFLLAAGACQASHAVLYSCATLAWRAAGIGETAIGALWGLGVVAEIVLFWFAAPLTRRLGAVGLLGLGAAGGVVRWTALAFTADLPALVAMQTLHALTFGACHLGAMAFLAAAIPARAMPLAQGLYYALSGGLLMAGAFQASGLLFDAFGQFAFLGMTALSLAGAVSCALLARVWRGAALKTA